MSSMSCTSDSEPCPPCSTHPNPRDLSPRLIGASNFECLDDRSLASTDTPSHTTTTTTTTTTAAALTPTLNLTLT